MTDHEAKALTDPDDSWKLYSEHGITGIGYIASQLNIHGIFFHSKYALNLYSDILRSKYSYFVPRMIPLFHPCFDKPSFKARNEREYDIGIFGVLDNGGKMTREAVNAFHVLRKKGKARNCILAGYNAKEWLMHNPDIPNDGLIVINKPSRESLSSLMSDTRVALQPRRSSTGESSGIIPMLISRGVPAIVSNVGAFSEYPAGIAFTVDNTDFTAEVLAAHARIEANESSDFEQERLFAEAFRRLSLEKFRSNILSSLESSMNEVHVRISGDRVATSISPITIERLKDQTPTPKAHCLHSQENS